MITLPKSTEINKQLAKAKVYETFSLTNAQKVQFDADIERMYFSNEISERTTTIIKGEKITSVFFVRVHLKQKQYNQKNILLLSKLINQNIVYILEYKNETQLAIYNTKLITTAWSQEAKITLQGLNLDTIWENLIKDIHNSQELVYTYDWDETLTVSDNIAEYDTRSKTLKKIEQLEKQARLEKQPKKKMALVEEIRKLKGEA